jgi:hypothetical protein
MFNSKKIKKLNQQQELLDAKINSLAHGQKLLLEDFENGWTELRQTIYLLEDDSLDAIKEQLSRIENQNDMLEKILKDITKNPNNNV